MEADEIGAPEWDQTRCPKCQQFIATKEIAEHRKTCTG